MGDLSHGMQAAKLRQPVRASGPEAIARRAPRRSHRRRWWRFRYSWRPRDTDRLYDHIGEWRRIAGPFWWLRHRD